MLLALLLLLLLCALPGHALHALAQVQVVALPAHLSDVKLAQRKHLWVRRVVQNAVQERVVEALEHRLVEPQPRQDGAVVRAARQQVLREVLAKGEREAQQEHVPVPEKQPEEPVEVRKGQDVDAQAHEPLLEPDVGENAPLFKQLEDVRVELLQDRLENVGVGGECDGLRAPVAGDVPGVRVDDAEHADDGRGVEPEQEQAADEAEGLVVLAAEGGSHEVGEEGGQEVAAVGACEGAVAVELEQPLDVFVNGENR